MENSFPIFDRFNAWLRESVVIKLMSIGFLTLILMLPSVWIQELIRERETRADNVIWEVSSKWGGAQTLSGPILKIPYKEVRFVDEWTNGVKHTSRVESIRNAYFLPETLDIDGKLNHDMLHRGMFDVVVYDSKIDMKASFSDVNFAKWNVADEQVNWTDASLLVGISDLMGIHENPKILSGGTTLISESSQDIGVSARSAEYNGQRQTGIVVNFDWTSRADMLKDYSINLQLQGSQQLYVVPVGKTTTFDVAGTWPSPSFNGKKLPNERNIRPDGFDASWKLLSFNRPFGDQWLDNEQSINGAEVGVDLVVPADQYQQSMRTAKYAALIIILAFVALFMVELTKKIRIHPFQYILIGAALILYYTLLLSLSEHVGYNAAYAISSIATILLLTLYSMSFLKAKPLVLLFSGVMSMFYVFIFVIIQAEDYSLLIGSIGLFVILAVVMYFSRNIKWYKDSTVPDTTRSTV